MNMFQRVNNMNEYISKSLKWQCKKTTSKKEEIIRPHSDSLRFFQSSFSDLRFLINTYEGLSFQKRCRYDHTTHRNMKSLVYIFEEF